jgi:DNA polymerase-3 subunit delta'
MIMQAGGEESIINSDMRAEIEGYESTFPAHSTVPKITAIIEARNHLALNASPLVTCEARMCGLARK